MRVPQQRWPLRWALYFKDGKTEFGNWMSDDKPACFVNKTGLLAARIERADRKAGKFFPVVECDGHDFRDFEFVKLASLASRRNYLVGLTMITNDEKVTVIIDGKINVRKLTDEEKYSPRAADGR